MKTTNKSDIKDQVRQRRSTSDKPKVSEEEFRSEKYSKTKPRASNGVETSKSTGSIPKYIKITCLVFTVIVILAFTANTKGVTENFEYIRSVLTGKDDCLSYPCINGGECVDKIGGYECSCKEWYTGKNCETCIPCVNHQCKNGAYCVPQRDGSYRCSCPPHIAGRFCEINERY
ncbi:protein crumbs homolog 1-like [Ruditapes philippinarum]|uniref:protein crumbs homolog 1-like n=1 Tax=Ruditapes philippinarum TaxID=129788 RepID=UPI00295AAA98|nr:protein crumbs homolog 1-like [Ruditapes philippinarum]